jgi:hypothetical protein
VRKRAGLARAWVGPIYNTGMLLPLLSMAASRGLPPLVLLALFVAGLTSLLAILGSLLIARRIRAIGGPPPDEEEGDRAVEDDS